MCDPSLRPLPETNQRYIICANPFVISEAERHAILKVGTADYEFNIDLTTTEVAQIQSDDPGDWVSRGALKIGRCAESAVFWCLDSDNLTILIGHDTENWSVAFGFPPTTLAEIRFALRELAPWLNGRSLPKGYAGHIPADYADIYDPKSDG